MVVRSAWDRFIEKVDVGDCWLWTAATKNGYGVFRSEDGSQVVAHRWLYKRLVSDIPDRLHLDHLCRVRACVNPDHLEPVTPQVNLARSYSPFVVNARKTHCGRGHPLAGPNLLRQDDGRRNCRKCRRDLQRARERRQRRAAGKSVGKGGHYASRTHCGRGHPLSPDNIYLRSDGGRRCKICHREAVRRSDAKRRRGG